MMSKTRFQSLPLLGAAALAVIVASGAAEASCKITLPGTKCAAVPLDQRAQMLEPGTALPTNARLLFNPQYYGLDPVSGGWRYYVVDRQVYRVDSLTMAVIDRVEGGNRRLW